MEKQLATIRQCAKCGTSVRYASGSCKSCVIARAKAAYVGDREKGKAYTVAYRVLNPDARAAHDLTYRAANNVVRKLAKAEWHAKNSEKVKLYPEDWHKANRMANRIQSHNNRERKKANGGRLSRGLAELLFTQQKGKCPCCRQPLGKDYHMDHIMPLALGGLNADENIQLLRAVCNMQKHTAHPIDFMQTKGFLL